MKEKGKKQIALRLSAELYDELMRWADDEFRSVNGQIEFLLSESARTDNPIHQLQITVLTRVIVILICCYLTAITEVVALINDYKVIVTPIDV